MRLALDASLRLGVAFAASEIAMQVVGYELGTGAGKVLGEVATYIGLALLATIGCVMIRNSLRHASKAEFDATRGAGLLITSLSISLDSLGIGIALPTVAFPLEPIVVTVSITTTAFRFIGLPFGSSLGQRYERGGRTLRGRDAPGVGRDRADDLVPTLPTAHATFDRYKRKWFTEEPFGGQALASRSNID